MLNTSTETPRSQEDPQNHVAPPRHWRYSSTILFGVATSGTFWLVFLYIVIDL